MENKPDWTPVGDSTDKILDDLYDKVYSMDIDMDESGSDVHERVLWMLADLIDKINNPLQCKDT